MKYTAVLVAGLAAVACASPLVERRGSSYCPATQCTIDTSGQYYDFAYLRGNPCNNKQPLDTLYDGDVVYYLGTPYQSGCGYYYAQVLVTGSNGRNTVGWIDSSYLNCNSYIPPPPAAPAASSTSSEA